MAGIMYDKNNLFAKIISGEVPSTKVFEDDMVIAINDRYPAAPVHVLVMPRGEYISFHDFSTKASPEEVAHFFRVIHDIAEKLGLQKSGYRIIANHGADASQTIPHFHVHLLGQKRLGPLIAGDIYHQTHGGS
jgi:diadenosine tetraphosphate (Ap4A) HIT family hydrolase